MSEAKKAPKVDRVKENDVLLREARSDDNDALCKLFEETAMKGDIDVIFERTPDFFKLYDIQKAKRRCFVFEDQSRKSVEACGVALFREGFIDGQKCTLGYMGDLRLTRRVRGGDFLGNHFGVYLKKVFEEEGCEIALTAILRSNKAARFALVRRRKAYPNAPFYKKVRGYSIVNVYVLRQKKKPLCELNVRCASLRDLDDMAGVLSSDHQKRAFGYVVNKALLEHRLSSWTGLKIEDFYLGFRGEELVAMCAPFDTCAFKRLRIGAYRGEFLKTKRLVNATRLFTNATKLPEVGEAFSYKTLTHTYVKNNDPLLKAELFRQVYNAHAKSGVHFLSLYVEDGAPFHEHLRPYTFTSVEADLYAVSLPGSSFNEKEFNQPLGFEMALV